MVSLKYKPQKPLIYSARRKGKNPHQIIHSIYMYTHTFYNSFQCIFFCVHHAIQPTSESGSLPSEVGMWFT